MLLCADTAMVAVPIWGLTIAAGAVVGLFTLIVTLLNAWQVRAAAEKQRLVDAAVQTHHDHDDERFDKLDARLTGYHRESQDRFSKLAADIQVAHTDIARHDERLAALKEAS